MTARRSFGAAAAVVALALLGGAAATGQQAGANGVQTADRQPEPADLKELKGEVLRYYGDQVDESGAHRPAADGAWALDVAEALDSAQARLEARLAEGVRSPAIVLDIDDTAESTFPMNAAHDFGFDQARNDSYVERGGFPAVEPVLRLARWADAHGVRVHFITARKDHLREATARGLRMHGYPEPAGLFLKPVDTAPDYLECGTTCSTAEFKAGTRAHLEALGDTVVLNIGDQEADLVGGHAELPVRLPNPMY